MNWQALLLAVVAALLAWWGFRTVKNNPEMFTKEAGSKTLQTLGVLALVLIVFIAVLVMILKSS